MNSSLLGAYGEHLAAKFLREDGYDIKAANFKTYVGEIDLIAVKKSVLCFVEVKTRQIGGMLPPADAVDAHKQDNLRKSASIYINTYDKANENYRFDIIEVFLDGKELKKINHIKSAF